MLNLFSKSTIFSSISFFQMQSCNIFLALVGVATNVVNICGNVLISKCIVIMF